MSAENELAVYKMANGEYWLCVRSCGDTIMEAQGEVTRIVGRCASFEEVEDAFLRASGAVLEPDFNLADAMDAGYVWTEHGGRFPSREELESQPPHFLRSVIYVRFARDCECVDFRDLQWKKWRVTEYDRDSRMERILGKRLWYAEAITLAHWHAQQEPGECKVEVPTHFRHFLRYDQHQRGECPDVDHGRLALPRRS